MDLKIQYNCRRKAYASESVDALFDNGEEEELLLGQEKDRLNLLRNARKTREI